MTSVSPMVPDDEDTSLWPHFEPMMKLNSFNQDCRPLQVLICCPWAGGNSQSFTSLFRTSELGKREDLIIYSCGYKRETHNLSVDHRFSSVEEAIDTLFPELQYLLSYISLKLRNQGNFLPFKVTLFGFSYGGIVAFELVRRLETARRYFSRPLFTFGQLKAYDHALERLSLGFRTNTINVATAQANKSHMFSIKKLIVCAVSSPTYLTLFNARRARKECRHAYSDAELTSHVIDCGGLPKGVDPVFLQRALPAIREDYHSFETYSHRSLSPLFSEHRQLPNIHTAITVLYSLRDREYIPNVEAVRSWDTAVTVAADDRGRVQTIDVSNEWSTHFSPMFDPVGRRRLISILTSEME